MANGLFNYYKEVMLGLGTRVDLDADAIRCGFVDEADWVPSLTADENFDDVDANGFIGASGGTTRGSGAALGTKTVTDGTFNAADTTLTAVTGDSAEGVLIYKDSGADTTSVLLAYYDTGVSGLPVTPNGSDITMVWYANGLWKL